MLKTRKILKSTNSQSYGDYEGVFGQGSSNFIYGADALAQILTHQILTVRGELKTRIDYGVEWFSRKIDPLEKIIFDTQIKDILVNNAYVQNVLAFNSRVQDGNYYADIKLSTTEGLLQINI